MFEKQDSNGRETGSSRGAKRREHPIRQRPRQADLTGGFEIMGVNGRMEKPQATNTESLSGNLG